MKIPIVYDERPVIVARGQFELPQNRKVIVAKRERIANEHLSFVI